MLVTLRVKRVEPLYSTVRRVVHMSVGHIDDSYLFP